MTPVIVLKNKRGWLKAEEIFEGNVGKCHFTQDVVGLRERPES